MIATFFINILTFLINSFVYYFPTITLPAFTFVALTHITTFFNILNDILPMSDLFAVFVWSIGLQMTLFAGKTAYFIYKMFPFT